MFSLPYSFTSGKLRAGDNPYAGYTGGEAEIKGYLKSHPDLARKAVGAGVNFARENPQMVMQGAGYASSAAAGGADVNPFADRV